MNSNKLALITLFLGVSSLLAGCNEQSDKDKIAEAQYCLDGATAATANACVAGIKSMNTSTSNALVCSAGFISAGVTSTENLSAALTAIKSSNGGNVTSMLTYLNLGSGADETFTACAASNSDGMALIGAMAKSATTLASLIPSYNIDSGTPPTAAQMQQAVADLASLASSSPTAAAASLEAIGSAVETVYHSTCSGSSVANADICNSIDSALATLPPSSDGSSIDLSSSSPAQIGSYLIDYWNHQNGH